MSPSAAKTRASATPWRPRSATPSRCTGRYAKVDGVEFRLHDTVLYNSIYRADDQLLVNTHVYGDVASQRPGPGTCASVAGGDIANTYVESFERVWDGATPLPED